MLTRCRNLLRFQLLGLTSNIYSFQSHYQPPSISNIALSQYQSMCLQGGLVDKSKFIYEIQNFDKGLLITRPRRWGKTLSLQMLKAFYGYTENVSVQHFNKSLFLGGDVTYHNQQYNLSPLEISKNKEFCDDNLGRFPIIHLTLKGLRKNSKLEVKDMLYISMEEAYSQHIHLFNRILFDEISQFTEKQKQSIDYSNLHKQNYSDLYYHWEKYANPNSPQTPWLKSANIFLRAHLSPNEINEIDIQTSILNLSEILTKYYQKPQCMVLIDEYDRSINNKFTDSSNLGNNEALKYCQDLLNSMFEYGVKYNQKVNKTIVVGILPLGSFDESDAWNFLQPCTVESGNLQESYGFTQDEVDKEIQSLKQISNEEKSQLRVKIRNYYHGYTNGNTQIYNAFSISNCLLTVRSGQISNCIIPYWRQSGSLYKLESLLARLDRNQLEIIVNNRMHNYKKSQQILTWSGIVNDPSSVIPLLLHLGYLTFQDQTSLRFPNMEVFEEMKNTIYPYYLKSIRQSYPNIWSEIDICLGYPEEYLEIIQTILLPEYNQVFEETRMDLSECHFTAMLSANGLTFNHKIVKEITQDEKLINMVYIPYSGSKQNTVVIHNLQVNQIVTNESDANDETLEEGFWQIFCNFISQDLLRTISGILQTILDQLICRVLLFTKNKTGLKEEYQFKGQEYLFTTAQAKQLITLFDKCDEQKRRMMIKGSTKNNENEIIAAREEFLEHCKANSILELFKTYQQM